MANIKISALPSVQPSGYTNDDLLVIVNYDVSSGTTKNTPLSGLTSYILSGVTFQADYLPLSGGTVTGDTIFNQGLTANTISASTYLGLPIFTANTPSTCIIDLYVDNLHGCSPITIHDSLQSTGSTASGILSIAFGSGNTASGDFSYVGGIYSNSFGNYSHAEGLSTSGTGISSHAEGRNTNSFGDYSHSEGWSSIASGTASHSEGRLTQSVGDYSHAEGQNTISSGQSSHAEGRSTLAIGSYSHAEGRNTSSIGNEGSHAEGDTTAAFGVSSHAEGYKTTSSGDSSHAEGAFTKAIGKVSHAEGEYTESIGTNSHAEGTFTKSIGKGSHAEGISTVSFGDYSHAEGLSSIASGTSSHAEGFFSQAIGYGSHAEGGFKKALEIISGGTAYGAASHAEGILTISSGTSSHAEGILTKSYGVASHAEGSGTTANGDYSHSEGGGTITYGDYSHAEGNNTSAFGMSSHAEGGSTIAIGESSHAEGSETKASGNYSHSEGKNTIASGESSHAEGYFSLAIGYQSHAEGSETKSIGSYSHSEGRYTISGWRGFSVDYISNGVVYLNSVYGDVTSEFSSNVLVNNTGGRIAYESVLFTGTSTEIKLYDKSVTTLSYVSDLNSLNSEYAEIVPSGIGGSHAEGFRTKSLGLYSHTEGYQTNAFGLYSHAEGRDVISNGNSSHAEGYSTSAYGDYSHSEGTNNYSYGRSSHSQNSGNKSGWIGLGIQSISSGIITLNSDYGDVTNNFGGEGSSGELLLYVEPILGDNKILKYYNVTFSSTTNTEIFLYDISISDGSAVADIGNINNLYLNDFVNESNRGVSSHAEGTNTKSIGDYSHSEGFGTKSIGHISHSSGENTEAIGRASHSEGNNTLAFGMSSHAEGGSTKSIGNYSHAEGQNTISGWKGFSVDYILNGVIYLNNSYGNVTSEFTSGVLITEGYGKINYQNAIYTGSSTEIILYDRSIGGGINYVSDESNLDSGYADIVSNITASHSEGYLSKSLGVYSHSEGYGTKAYGAYSHAEGKISLANAPYSHAEGDVTSAYGESSHSEGRLSKSFGMYSHSQNNNNKSGWIGLSVQSVGGGIITIQSSYGDVTNNFGGEGASGDLLLYLPIGLGNNKILPYYNITFSSTTNTEIFIYDTVISNGYAVADITDINNNLYLFDFANNTNIGDSSHSEGNNTKAIGDYSHSEGYGTKAFGHISHASGRDTQSMGIASYSEGIGTIALADYQHVSGKYNLTATTEGAFILGNGTDDSNRSNLLVAGDGEVNVSGKTITTNFQMTSGATTAGYVLTDSDGFGNAQWQPASGITGVGNVFKYTTTSAFTASVTQTITHNLNTKFVHCSVWDSSDQLVTAQVVRTSGNQTNAVDITISTSGTYDILITG